MVQLTVLTATERAALALVESDVHGADWNRTILRVQDNKIETSWTMCLVLGSRGRRAALGSSRFETHQSIKRRWDNVPINAKYTP